MSEAIGIFLKLKRHKVALQNSCSQNTPSVLLVSLALLHTTLLGQTSRALPSPAARIIASAPISNSWQLTPTAASSVPKVSQPKEIRAARDAYADKVYGYGIPLDRPEAQREHVSDSDGPAETGDTTIPTPYQGEVVVTGLFESFDTILTQTKQAIYTEMHIRVDAVLSAPLIAHGSLLDVIIPGGIIQLSDVKALSFEAKPRPFGLIPGQEYILFLRSAEPGHFYLLRKSMQLTRNDVIPNSVDDIEAAEAGKWPFTGLSRSQALDYLSSVVRGPSEP